MSALTTRGSLLLQWSFPFIIQINMYFKNKFCNFFRHFPILNMETISTFVIVFLHCYRSTRCSRCIRCLSGYPITCLIGHYFEHNSYFVNFLFCKKSFSALQWCWFLCDLNSRKYCYFNCVAICLIWFLTPERLWL